MKQVEKLAEEYYLNEYPGILDRYDSRFYEAGFRKALELVVEFLKTKHIHAHLKMDDIISDIYDDGTFILNLKEIKYIGDKEVE